MLMSPQISKRLRWERWKCRHALAWDFLTAPIVLASLLILMLYRIYLLLCRIFGWKPWKMP